MSQLQKGDKIPEHTFLTLKDDAPTPLSTQDAFGSKKVVLFGLPGALYAILMLHHSIH